MSLGNPGLKKLSRGLGTRGMAGEYPGLPGPSVDVWVMPGYRQVGDYGLALPSLPSFRAYKSPIYRSDALCNVLEVCRA